MEAMAAADTDQQPIGLLYVCGSGSRFSFHSHLSESLCSHSNSDFSFFVWRSVSAALLCTPLESASGSAHTQTHTWTDRMTHTSAHTQTHVHTQSGARHPSPLLTQLSLRPCHIPWIRIAPL